MKELTRFALSMVLTAIAAVKGAASPNDPRVRIPFDPSIVPMDGKRLLVYELEIDEAARPPQSLQALTVTDPDSHAQLLTLQGDALRGRIASSTSPHTNTIYLEVELPPSSGEPHRLMHRLEWSTDGGVPAADVRLIGSVDTHVLPHLAPPLDGGSWTAVHSPEWERGHRRVVYHADAHSRIPGRYAIDWMGVDSAGHTSHGEVDRPSDALGYGAPVHAGADSVVAAVRDGIAEATSIRGNPKHTENDAAGNYVALDLKDGHFAFYEHLKPGSVTVRAGQNVQRGQIIGALGFSGDSTAPHLHLHVANAADPVKAEGVPFVIDEFCELGRYEDVEQLGNAPWHNTPPLRRERSWPGYNVVVSFAGC